ncbi:MAG: hypothetical protein ACJAXX_002205 [Roseivirga sp.]|jgi:hypothetical protein
MSKIGLLFNGVWSQYAMAKAPKYKDIYELIYIYDFSLENIQHLEAIVIPFQSNQEELTARKEVIYDFLKLGKKVFVEGDTTTGWMEGVWEDRPVNNYWWVENPNNPPVAKTDYSHPVYQGLKPRHACWHTHGIYTEVPNHAEVVQTNGSGEVVSWQTKKYGGVLFATTLDPIVEHGVQQITHLDNYVDKLTEWLSGVKPVHSAFEILEEDYGITSW